MEGSAASAELTAKLAAAWPGERWRDVHVLAAVSGGADSMALLRALLAIKLESGGRGRLYAGHINHGLRREESDHDEAWLHEQCADLGIPLRVERADVAALAQEQGDGIEAAARALRYRLLSHMGERTGCRFVATAHTRDDQIETVLFRFMRGSGLRGLGGIPLTRPLAPSVALVRPLLECTRVEVLAYLQRIGQDFRHDATNDEVRQARNRIRGELLPYLREHFNAEVDAAILRTASLACESQAVIDDLATTLLAQCRASIGNDVHPVDDGMLLAAAPLAGQPELLVAEVLRHAWRDASLPEQSMTRSCWRQLARFALSSSEPAALNLPGGLRATRPVRGVLKVGISTPR